MTPKLREKASEAGSLTSRDATLVAALRASANPVAIPSRMSADESSPSPTFVLLGEWHRGDPQALDALLRRDLPWITAKVEARLGPGLREKVATDDVVQEAMLAVLRYGPRFQMSSREQFRTLLARIIENVIRAQFDYFAAERRRQRASPLQSDSVLCLDPPKESVATPSQMVQAQDDANFVALALNLIDPHDKRLLVARYFDQQPFEEIAQELGIGMDAARQRFHRAMDRVTRMVKRLRQGEVERALDVE